MRRTFLLSLFLLCIVTVSAFDIPKAVSEYFGDRTLLPIEGAWKWTGGALVVIEETVPGEIRIILIDSPDPLIETPKVIGTGQFGGKENTYNIELITTGSLKGTKTKGTGKAKFVAHLSDSRRLTLTPYSTGVKVNFWRLVPYLFRFSISRDKEPSGLDGAIRVWPPLGSPEFPIIL